MPYFSVKPSTWPWPNIGSPGIVVITVATPKYLSSTRLLDRRFLVGVVHEVDVALEDLGVEFERVLDDEAVFGVLLVAHHVHERAVVDAVHAESADEVALHQPERLGQQQRVGRLGGDAIDHLAPELLGICRLKSRLVMAYSAREGMRRRGPAPDTSLSM